MPSSKRRRRSPAPASASREQRPPTPPPRSRPRWEKWPVAAAIAVLLVLGGGATIVYSNLNRSAGLAAALPSATPTSVRSPTASAGSSTTGVQTAPTATRTPYPTMITFTRPSPTATSAVSPTPVVSATSGSGEPGGLAVRALGPADAPVTIIEYTDLECVFCKRHHVETFPRIMDIYKGKVRYIFRDFPATSLHPQADKAAEAARCAADQGKFWEFADELFRIERALTPADYPRVAEKLGLNRETFTACTDSGRYATAVQNELLGGVKLGVEGTPSFFINGRLVVGALPFESFTQYIDAALAAAGR